MTESNPFRILGNYDGYADFAARGFKEVVIALGDFAERISEKYKETGELPRRVEDLLACLFFEFRRAHHVGDINFQDEYVWVLNEAIQELKISATETSQNDISAQRLIEEVKRAIRYLDDKALAFLFSTGKVELIVRNLLAKSLSENLDLSDTQRVMREWSLHDLVILNSGSPEVILEGKAWIHADAVHPNKLDKGKAEIKKAFEKDVAKIQSTRLKYPKSRGFISTIFSSIDVTKGAPRVLELISYPKLHEAGIKSEGSFEDLHGMARSLFTDFLKKRPEVFDIKREILFVGIYEGMEIWVDVFLIEI